MFFVIHLAGFVIWFSWLASQRLKYLDMDDGIFYGACVLVSLVWPSSCLYELYLYLRYRNDTP